MAADRSAVIQSNPATGCSASRMRASVSNPRSPTRTTRDKPKRCRSLSICGAKVMGSAVLPSHTSTATGLLDGGTAAQEGLEALDEFRRPFGEIGQGTFAYCVALAKRLAEQDG